MQYRFRVSKKRTVPRSKRPLRLKGENTLRRKAPLPEPIEEISFYEFEETAPQREPALIAAWRMLRALFKRLGTALSAAARAIGRFVTAVAKKLIRPPRAKRIHALPVLSGILCAALLVSALSAGTVLLGLFAGYGKAFDSVTVPNFVGSTPDAVLSEDESRFNLIVQYVQNPNVEPGVVISQTPHAGITRRLYGKNAYCSVTLTVSEPQVSYQLENLSGRTQRDAALLLRNRGMTIRVTEEYSNTVSKGTVLGTLPETGATLLAGDTVTLRVSLGKQLLLSSVPNLFGLSERDANSLLHAAGFEAGTVSYQTSSYPTGTIIAQSHPAYTSLEEGSVISYTVSAGDRYALRTVPDVYGMSLSEAEASLRSAGLVIGGTYPVAHAAPRGTVISQFPAAGTPITSSTVSVTLYVSS